MKRGTIKNNLDFEIQYQLLNSPTQRKEYSDLQPGQVIQLTGENNLLVLRMGAIDSFDFKELSDRITYCPVQFREGTDENGAWRVYVFEYTITDSAGVGDGEDDGDLEQADPPIPPPPTEA
ncbi:MAG: hypothetical protein FH748_06255 [Balneolaceae bacterium]|nr:hypothetical protein [Balneolaceae bacterium]